MPVGTVTEFVFKFVLILSSEISEKKLYLTPLAKLLASLFNQASRSATVMISIPPSFHLVKGAFLGSGSTFLVRTANAVALLEFLITS